MIVEADHARTRRGMFAGAIGGLTALVGSRLGRAAPVEAGAGAAENDPNAVHKGVNNSTSAATSVTCNGATAIRAISQGGGTNKSGVFAQANGTNSRGVTGVGVTGDRSEQRDIGARSIRARIGHRRDRCVR
jgi:hypothetical protein